MTEVICIDRSLWEERHLRWAQVWSSKKNQEGYNEQRGVRDIEDIFCNMFSIKEVLQEIAERFPMETIRVLDSGCGECKTLGEIKDFFVGLDRDIHTTGITLQEDHIEWADRNQVDQLIIGPVQNYQFPDRYHLVIDIFGPTRWEKLEDILPIYGEIVTNGGIMIFIDPSLPFGNGNTPEQITIPLLEEHSMAVRMSGVIKGTSGEFPILFWLAEKQINVHHAGEFIPNFIRYLLSRVKVTGGLR